MTDGINSTTHENDGFLKQSQINGNKNTRATEVNKLKCLCNDNAEYFAKDSSESGQRMYISFLAMVDVVDQMLPVLDKIQERVAEFDFDANTPGNGYRSFLSIIDAAIKLAQDLCEKVTLKRESIFRKYSLTKDVESCSHLLVSLQGCLKPLEKFLLWSEKGNLFISDDHSPVELFDECDEVNQHCFYGRNLGFQYCDSIKNILQLIALSMILFSEVYYSQGSLLSKATNSFVSTTKYITDPAQRARRIVNIFQHAEVDFCKAFWFLSETEIMNQLPAVVSPSVAVSKIINITAEPLFITVENGRKIEIPVPSSYIGRKPIQVRLISHKFREGMIGTKNKSVGPASKGLLFHCHGGGFVAQSSKSHEGYLRDWAKDLDVPILCVDYSLAPEAPFPRALEEILYAYCWVINNHNLLGTTGEIIVGAGDSAGANLLLSTTLKCINMGIPTPKGLFVAYVPTGVHFVPSPGRMMSLMDPLLPFGFMMRCLKAYACPDIKLKEQNSPCDATSDTESFEEISESDLMELQAHKSPISETSDTLTYGSLTSADDNVNGQNDADGEKYVSDFLEKYVLDSDTDTDGTRIPVIRPESVSTTSTQDYSLHKRLLSFVSNLRSGFSKYIGDRTLSGAEKLLDMDYDTRNHLIDKFSFTVPMDPYLSPELASDEDLSQFPPTRILTVHLDPCIDDCVTFAKKLKVLGNDVKLDILSGLPHGFLNFSLFSKEAYDGSKICIERINELLHPEQ